MAISKVSVEEICNLIDQLETDKKVEIFERLKSQLFNKKWDNLLNRIDKKLADTPISEKEINDEVNGGRKAFASDRS